jgi:hypothetical protein
MADIIVPEVAAGSKTVVAQGTAPCGKFGIAAGDYASFPCHHDLVGVEPEGGRAPKRSASVAAP